MVTSGTWQSLETIRPIRNLMPVAEPEGLEATAEQRATQGEFYLMANPHIQCR